MLNKKNISIKNGVSIIEILIIIFIISSALITLFNLATFSLKLSILNKENALAKDLAEESLEAVRNFRDGTDWPVNGLGTLNVNTDYYLNKTTDSPPKWNFATGVETMGRFNRKVVLDQVYRDANGNIAQAGTADSNAKKITATVYWKDKKVEIITYLTNWK